MATPKDIVAHMVAGKLICTTCSANMLVPEDGEVTRWDIEPQDVCEECQTPVHPEAKRYGIGYNMCGYMPDMTPYTVVGLFSEAREALINELETARDVFLPEWYDNKETEEEETQEYNDAISDVERWTKPNTIVVRGMAYWVTIV